MRARGSAVSTAAQHGHCASATCAYRHAIDDDAVESANGGCRLLIRRKQNIAVGGRQRSGHGDGFSRRHRKLSSRRAKGATQDGLFRPGDIQAP